MVLGRQPYRRKVTMQDDEEPHSQSAACKKKRSRRRRKPRSSNNLAVKPVDKAFSASKRPHDAPMTKRDLYFALHCGLVSIGHGAPTVARVTMINWDAEVVLDTFVQVPVPVTDFRETGISAEAVSARNPQAMTFAKVRQSVNQILKGKILVGHRLQDHLTALGLVHPPSDVRDASQFRRFQYEEIDGVTKERAVVERSVADLAAEFLQREVASPSNPMNICMASLDLYKEFRKEWEASLVHHAPPENAPGFYASRLAFAGPVPSCESQSPRSCIDETVHPYAGSGAAPQQRGSSWFSRSRSTGRATYGAHDQNIVGSPLLTSENLEMLNYSRYPGASDAYGQQHPFTWIPSSDSGAPSNPGSSTYYEGSSAVSEYSFASDSVTTTPLLDESLNGYSAQPQHHSSSSASWFRFGSRRTKYSQQEFPQHETQKPPMTSLEEEPDDQAGPLEPSIRLLVDIDENLPSRADSSNDTEKTTAEDEKTSSSSWFIFRRPKSPGPGIDRPSGIQNRNRSGACVQVVEPEDTARLSGNPLADYEEDVRFGGELDDVCGEEKSSSSWFSFRRPKSPAGLERPPTPPRRRRSSMGTGNLSDNVQSGVRQASTGVISRRNSLDNISSTPRIDESEKSTTNISWFSFRRSTKAPVGVTKDRDSRGDPMAILQLPTLHTEFSNDSEEDWMREVVGSPPTQKKELLALAWSEGSLTGFEASLPREENQQSAPNSSKESTWLPRFLRSSKTSEPMPLDENVESSSRDPWLEQLVVVRSVDRPKTALNPAFFSGFEVGSGLPPPGTFSRVRLETEATLPTISSETEDTSQLDESSSASDDIMITAMTQDMEHNFAYLTI